MTVQVKPIAIYGAGGFAREVAWLVQSCDGQYKVACFIDDNESVHGKVLNGIPVMGIEEAYRRFPRAWVVGGVGTPKTRQALMERSAAAGFGFETIIHPRVERSQWMEIG